MNAADSLEIKNYCLIKNNLTRFIYFVLVTLGHVTFMLLSAAEPGKDFFFWFIKALIEGTVSFEALYT